MLVSALNTIKKYNLISKNDTIIIGLSGGADSVSLFHLLLSLSDEYNLTLVAVHINHGIRGEEAQRDMDFVASLCNSNNVIFKKFFYNVPLEAKKLSMTEEEAGRILRYKAFNLALEKYNGTKIAVAHNMNDNAETIFMRLCRGTGIKGLGGINVKRDNIIRPLLYTSREEIENYCDKNDFSYITDSTNNCSVYTRNKIRLKLIPWVKENLNNNIISALSLSSEIISEENEYLDKIALSEFKRISLSSDKVLLPILELKKLDIVILRRVLRFACLSCSSTLYDFALKHINLLIDLIYKPTGKNITLPNSVIAEVQYNNLYIHTNSCITSFSYSYILKKNEVTFINELNRYVTFSDNKLSSLKNYKNVYTISLNYDKINLDIYLRSRKNGDRIFLKGINNYKKLKDIFIDLKIPREERDYIPLLATDNEIINIIGYRFSPLFAVTSPADNISYIQIWED